MKWLCGFLLLFLPVWVSAETLRIGDELWSRPRSGARLVHEQGLARLVRALEAPSISPAGLRLRYGTREEDLLWAEELRDWLVALGLPSRQVTLLRDPSVPAGEIVVESSPPAGEKGGP